PLMMTRSEASCRGGPVTCSSASQPSPRWETTSPTTSSPPAHCTWWRPRWTSPPAPDPTSGRAASSTPGPDRGDARHGRPPSVFHLLNHPSVSTPPRTAPLPPLCSDYSLRSFLVHHPLSPGR